MLPDPMQDEETAVTNLLLEQRRGFLGNLQAQSINARTGRKKILSWQYDCVRNEEKRTKQNDCGGVAQIGFIFFLDSLVSP